MNFLSEEGEDQREKEGKKINGVGSGMRCGGAVLESNGDDVHILLEHLCESSEELPFKSEALTCEKVHFSISKWDNGVPQKPSNPLSLSIVDLFFNLFLSIRLVAKKNCEQKEEELKHKFIIA